MSKHRDDSENPPLRADFFARARRGLDHVPGPMRTALLNEQARRRGRGPQRMPTKKLISLRLDQEIVIAYRNTGRGWQGRINAALRKTVRTKPSPHVTTGSAVQSVSRVRRPKLAKRAAKRR